MTQSIFDSSKVYTRYAAELLVHHICGGIPSNPRVIEGFIKTKLAGEKDSFLRETIATTMLERGVERSDAVDAVIEATNLNGFKRDETGLYIEGRQVKAAIKEAANVAWASSRRKWGAGKGTKNFFAEHVFTQEDPIYLGVTEASGIQQRFVPTFRGSGISYEEYVDEAKVTFIVECDTPGEISDGDWEQLWIRAERLGLGAVRSQGFGRFVVTRWEQLSAGKPS